MKRPYLDAVDRMFYRYSKSLTGDLIRIHIKKLHFKRSVSRAIDNILNWWKT
jgi:hypothetical protein